MAEGIRSDQCGVCMEIGAQRTDPRLLPCTHVLCAPCLRSDQTRVSNHRCPVCRLVGTQFESMCVASVKIQGRVMW